MVTNCKMKLVVDASPNTSTIVSPQNTDNPHKKKSIGEMVTSALHRANGQKMS